MYNKSDFKFKKKSTLHNVIAQQLYFFPYPWKALYDFMKNTNNSLVFTFTM